MAPGSTQPLTEMSTRSISLGKGGRCVRLTTLPLSCAAVMKSGNLNFLEPSGPLQAYNGTALPYLLVNYVCIVIILTAGLHMRVNIARVPLCFSGEALSYL